MAEAGSSSRISKEKANLSQHFDEGNVRWCETSVDLDTRTLSGKQYTLRLFMHEGFPNSCPTLAVVRPAVLQLKNGRAIPSNSQEFQTVGRTYDGFQGILHYPPSDWHASHSIHQIFKKGILWVRAYEEHLVTGMNMDHHIRLYRQAANESSNHYELGHPVPIWSEVQVRRLAREKEMLDKFYSLHGQVKWTDDRRAVDVTVQSLQKNEFTLRVYLPHDFPNSCPDLAIVSPEKLLKVNGDPLPERSEDFATLDKRDGRFMKICHFGPTQWMDSYNITSVVNMKGLTWVNAYEYYLMQKDISFAECLLQFTQCSEQN